VTRVCMVAFTDFATDARVRREAEALAERGDTVDVICLRGEGKGPDLQNIRTHGLSKFRYRGSNPLGYIAQYALFLVYATLVVGALHLRRRYHVVQVHTMPDFMVFSAIVPKLLGAKVILDVHDLSPQLYQSKFNLSESSPPIRLLTWVERQSIAFADAAIAVHEPHLVELVRHGNPRRKFAVVMNAADPSMFPTRTEAAPKDGFRLVYHGTISQRHGLEVAVRAVAKAREEIDALEFLVLGDGDDVDRIARLVRELDVQANVTVRRGFVPIEQLAHVLADADVGVVPIYDDAFTRFMLPVKLLEYAALGIPAICTSTETIRAYFDDTMVRFVAPGDAGDLAAAIVELYRDPARRQRLSYGARLFDERHGWGAERSRYYKLIDSLVGTARNGRRR
jgi:glycosyltransferase involved in cell wall biosynthesis